MNTDQANLDGDDQGNVCDLDDDGEQRTARHRHRRSRRPVRQ
jgi:hypothetical protein